MRSHWFQKAVEVEPYSKLAPIYDFVMRHVNYERWALYLKGLFSKADAPVRTVLDIACGTGSLLLELAKLHLTVAGFDASNLMARIARRKAVGNGLHIPVWCGSMWDFRLRVEFDACLCTYDSLNYCMELAQCSKVLHCVSEVLRPGGLFIFDVCTERNSRANFQNYSEDDTTDEFSYNRHSYYLRRQRLQVNEFIIEYHANTPTVYRETHKQRIYRIREIEEIIPRDRFELSGKFDGFSARPGTEKSFRVHFVLKRI